MFREQALLQTSSCSRNRMSHSAKNNTAWMRHYDTTVQLIPASSDANTVTGNKSDQQ